MDNYIEVIGKAGLKETVTKYVAVLSVEARSKKTGTAWDGAMKLRNKTIQKLKESGIKDKEIHEEGVDIDRYWFSSKKGDKEASSRIYISTADIKRLIVAFNMLKPLYKKQSYSLSVMMFKHFEATEELQEEAGKRAVQNANKKAQTLAGVCSVSLAGIVQVEELYDKPQHYQIASMSVPMKRLSPVIDDMEYEELGKAERLRSIHYRVRFAISIV